MSTFKPDTKGKFKTSGGKRQFPPEWYAAQAARRKKKEDGTYKEGQFKESRKLAPELDKLPSHKKKREMPESWKEKQKQKAQERKEAEAKGEYKRKTRGKASEYRDKARKERDEGLNIEKSGARRVELDSYDSARNAISSLYKGNQCEIDVGGGKIEKVTVIRDGMYPGTKVGVTSSGSIEYIDTDNIVAAYLF